MRVSRESKENLLLNVSGTSSGFSVLCKTLKVVAKAAKNKRRISRGQLEDTTRFTCVTEFTLIRDFGVLSLAAV